MVAPAPGGGITHRGRFTSAPAAGSPGCGDYRTPSLRASATASFQELTPSFR
jgi:hypothetical protein